MPDRFPERIVCLTEEPTETLYLLGEQHRIVGISGFTVRPPEARRDKPKVSAFLSADTERIVALRPDLVVGFSDLQADIARDLVRAGLDVWISNHRTVAGILAFVQRLAGIVGAHERGERLVAELQAGLDAVRAAAAQFRRRPRVWFEEWDEPLISAIGWAHELVAIAGGDGLFPERAQSAGAKGRIVADPQEVIDARPDVIVGSWCGKKFRPEQVRARPGWDAIPAVRDGELHEVDSADILQPGPAALTDGVRQLHAIFARWQERTGR